MSGYGRRIAHAFLLLETSPRRLQAPLSSGFALEGLGFRVRDRNPSAQLLSFLGLPGLCCLMPAALTFENIVDSGGCMHGISWLTVSEAGLQPERISA